jgi:hypothetical protein
MLELIPVAVRTITKVIRKSVSSGLQRVRALMGSGILNQRPKMLANIRVPKIIPVQSMCHLR